jgi:hypothetical protein
MPRWTQTFDKCLMKSGTQRRRNMGKEQPDQIVSTVLGQKSYGYLRYHR